MLGGVVHDAQGRTAPAQALRFCYPTESATNAKRHLADGRLKAVFGLDKAIKVKAHFMVYPARYGGAP